MKIDEIVDLSRPRLSTISVPWTAAAEVAGTRRFCGLGWSRHRCTTYFRIVDRSRPRLRGYFVDLWTAAAPGCAHISRCMK